MIAAISEVDYNPSNDQWTIQISTSVQAPFKLSNPIAATYNGTINSDNRLVPSDFTISSVTACNSNLLDCQQVTTVYFQQGSAAAACLGLDGFFTITYEIICSVNDSLTCPLVGGETGVVTAGLTTGDGCPTATSINFTVTTLSSFSDAGLTIPRTSFITNQIAYFGAIVTSDQAQISARSVQNNSVCFQIGSGACQPVTYSVIASVNGNDPVFSMSFNGDANNRAVFASLLSSAVAEAQYYTVKATIDVQFTGAKRDVQSKSVDTVSHVILIPTTSTNSVWEPASSASSLSLFGIHL